MSIVRFLWFWVSFWLATLVFYLKLWFMVANAKFITGEPVDRASHRLATQWGKSFFWLNPGWDYTIVNKELLPKVGEAAVVIANHSSAMDISAVFATGIDFRWLSKASNFKVPLVGHAMRSAGYVAIDRGRPDSHKKALRESADWLVNGVSMLFFPEGTRSKDGKLGSFKVGAFRLAEENGVPVVPLIIEGARDMMKKDSFMPRPATVTVSVGEPMRARQGESHEDYALRVEQYYRGQLKSGLDGHENHLGQMTTQPT